MLASSYPLRHQVQPAVAEERLRERDGERTHIERHTKRIRIPSAWCIIHNHHRMHRLQS